MARDRRRPVARVHLLLAGVGGGRPAPTADGQSTTAGRARAVAGPAARPAARLKPRRGLRAVRARDAGRVAARSRLHRHNGRDSIRERRAVSAIGVVRERPSVRRDNEQLSSHRQCSTGLDESATSLFVLPINEQQHVSLASLVDAADPMPRPDVRGRLVTG